MSADRLISMANQISDFFKSDPDSNVAQEGIAQHLKRFWAKKMRLQLLQYAETDSSQLSDLLKNSLQKYKAYLTE